jgi:hypothetical protein
MIRIGPANEVTIFDDAFANSTPHPDETAGQINGLKQAVLTTENFITSVRLALRRDISTQSYQPVLDNGRADQ